MPVTSKITSAITLGMLALGIASGLALPLTPEFSQAANVIRRDLNSTPTKPIALSSRGTDDAEFVRHISNKGGRLGKSLKHYDDYISMLTEQIQKRKQRGMNVDELQKELQKQVQEKEGMIRMGEQAVTAEGERRFKESLRDRNEKLQAAIEKAREGKYPGMDALD